MASTTPNVFLGFSGSILSLLLETLASLGEHSPVSIIENLPCDDSIAFAHPQVRTQRIPLNQWRFQRGRDRLAFAQARSAAKLAVYAAFQEACGIIESDFANLVSPNAVVASSASLSLGCYLEPGVIISPFTTLGFGVTINRAASIGHHCHLGAFTTINPGCHIAGHCEIENNVQIGIGTVVFDHVKIGAGSVIGGGSVVTKDIPSNVVAFGSPCRVIRELSK